MLYIRDTLKHIVCKSDRPDFSGSEMRGVLAIAAGILGDDARHELEPVYRLERNGRVLEVIHDGWVSDALRQAMRSAWIAMTGNDETKDVRTLCRPRTACYHERRDPDVLEERCFRNLQKWSEKYGQPFSEYFTLPNANIIELDIELGDMPGWVMLSCRSGVQYYTDYILDRKTQIEKYLNVPFWVERFAKHPDERRAVLFVCRGLGL